MTGVPDKSHRLIDEPSPLALHHIESGSDDMLARYLIGQLHGDPLDENYLAAIIRLLRKHSAPSAIDATALFRTRVGDSLEVLDAIREALAGQDRSQILELVNGYIDRAKADLRNLA